ncbi:Sapep family Mn(2+)-dependent dipeptidase [Anaerovorax odorimutans]|uniref:Sapep family Mn(2+)-dependent dipeptidase n=1 Tax=Anaerovorax odorimutans TaxID=109327 RepID=A0ABT1RKX8_9FIRM|nr:Sapep family Mn(2+)-dependent dipeptidase [Anaerovorax odorimutans]MCQ4635820.1 Sapep family Mn(2+)-dependent dipeptidase [Anaerovorax odorimutans]
MIEKKFDELLEGYHQEMVGNLCRLIRIKSVLGPEEPDAPFGRGPKEAFDFAMNLGREKGFECVNFDNYAGEINFGEGEEAAGVICHMDVVPEGEGWTYEPYGGQVVDGNIYGRGAVDDKGCFIAAFYACLALKESGVPLRRQIKHIIGTNEEQGYFPCIRYYKEHTDKMPICGIVPDSWFPAAFAEKGFLSYEFHKTFSGEQCGTEQPVLRSISAGSALNVVIPEAKAVFEGTKEQRAKILRTAEEILPAGRIKAMEDGDRLTIYTVGKSAHASAPEIGINAGSLLLRVLRKLEFFPQSACRTLHAWADQIAFDTDGSGLGVAFCDHTGPLTNNLGIFRMDENSLYAGMNIRYPVTQDTTLLEEQLSCAAAKSESRCEIIMRNPHFYVDPESPLVQTLTDIYRDMTGDEESQPVAHGGGSYARILENFIPYGPSIRGEELCFHKQDEHISCERLLLLSKIYARALYAMAK